VTSRQFPSSFDILDKFLARELLAGLDDLCDASVAHPQRPALAGETEAYLVSVDGNMPVLEGSQAIAVVLLRVVVVPQADQGGFEEMHHRCQHFLPRQPAHSHVLAHFLADGRKRVREGNNMLVLGAFPHLAEARVIAVLLAARGVVRAIVAIPILSGLHHHYVRI
jgi:hypothetical protein